MSADAPQDPNPHRAGRRATDPQVTSAAPSPAAAGQTSPSANLPVPVGVAKSHPRADPPGSPVGVVEAQILGQTGQKRGLRGGKPVLDQARSAYLGAEWSGSADRRPRRGVISKTEI